MTIEERARKALTGMAWSADGLNPVTQIMDALQAERNDMKEWVANRMKELHPEIKDGVTVGVVLAQEIRDLK